MTHRRLSRTLAGLTMVMLVVGGGLVVAHYLQAPGTPRTPWLAFMLLGLTATGVGAVVASRRPQNPIGWLLLVLGVTSGVQLVTGEYATYNTYVLQDNLPAAQVSGWICGLASVLSLALLSFVLLLFPNGRFLSRHWQRFGHLAVLLIAVSATGVAVLPGEMGLTPGIENPFAVSLDNPVLRTVGAASWELGLGAPLMVCALAGVASLFVRSRTGDAEHRAQLKWVLYAAGVGFSAIVLSSALVPVLGEWLPEAVWNVALASIPVAVGVSILRYRLYDIDRLVSRTVTYGLLTALLVAIYVSSVGAISQLSPTGNSLAVAASTLAVAGIFQPLRRRLQGAVDRRFNRGRYDAERTLEAFSLRLRDEVDLDAMQAELLAVVQQTVQPVAVGLWLRRT
ncbi:MAG: hypothetical protein M4D85_02125 [Actinomycetota bacterium]|nr:hypothetical protein [Actinomycetota bacterium]